MKKKISGISYVFVLLVIAAALTFLAFQAFSLYDFGDYITVKIFCRIAAALPLAAALLSLAAAAVNSRKAFINKTVLFAVPVVFAAAEGISYLVLRLIGVIRWQRLGNTVETGFAPLMAFMAASAVIALLLSFIIAEAMERCGEKGKKRLTGILGLVAIALFSVAFTYLVCDRLNVYGFRYSVSTKAFLILAFGFVLMIAVIAVPLALRNINRKEASLSSAVLFAFPVVFAAAEGISYLALKLLGVIEWTRFGQTEVFVTGISPLMIFTAASVCLCLPLSMAVMEAAERGGKK